MNNIKVEIMKSDIHHCGKIGCDGVVIGMLNAAEPIRQTGSKKLHGTFKAHGIPFVENI